MGVVGTTVHWQYAGGEGSFFEELMVVQIGVLVATAFGCRAPRLPPNVAFLATGGAIVACTLLKQQTIEFGFVGLAALAIGLAFAVAGLLVVGGRGLARAEIVK
ncbi:MAG: hypothetical protein OXK76_01860 [Gammaproteobacteria bacterium]|nr:hypothetical protein [Gammaproteobacteria bacterium]